MPLVASVLADELNKIEPAGNEVQAAFAWSTAFINYLADVTGGGVAAFKPSIMGLIPVMAAAMQGMSAPGAGPQKIQDGIVAVWSSLVGVTSTVFPGTIPPLTPPTGNSGIAAAIMAIAPANTAGNVTRAESMRLLADAIHTTQITGGLVTFPGSPPFTGPIL